MEASSAEVLTAQRLTARSAPPAVNKYLPSNEHTTHDIYRQHHIISMPCHAMPCHSAA